jgi:hypothetical protein
VCPLFPFKSDYLKENFFKKISEFLKNFKNFSFSPILFYVPWTPYNSSGGVYLLLALL